MTRRAPIVIGATALSMFGLLSYHTHATSGTLAPAGSAKTTTNRGAAGSSTGSSGTTGSSTGSSGTTGSSTGSSGTTGSSGGTPTTSATVTGPMEQYGYGQLDVSVTLSGTTITKIAVPTLQTVDPYSQQLANQVIPMLRQEVLRAQNANINGITGATYTSEAFAQSLQSALKKTPKG